MALFPIRAWHCLTLSQKKKKTVADLHFFAHWTLQFSKTYLAFKKKKKHGAGGSESSVKEKERRESEQKKQNKTASQTGCDGRTGAVVTINKQLYWCSDSTCLADLPQMTEQLILQYQTIWYRYTTRLLSSAQQTLPATIFKSTLANAFGSPFPLSHTSHPSCPHVLSRRGGRGYRGDSGIMPIRIIHFPPAGQMRMSQRY